MDAPGILRGAGAPAGPVAHQLRAVFRQVQAEFVQHVQHVLPLPVVPEDAGLLLIDTVEVRQEVGVFRPQLADGKVHEAPPLRSPALDELQIVGAEKGAGKAAAELGSGLHPHAVHKYLFPLPAAQVDVDPLLPHFGGNEAGDGPLRLLQVEDIPVGTAAEGAGARQVVDRFQEVGLALGVAAGDDVHPRVEITLQLPVVAEIPKLQPLDDHASATRRTSPPSSTRSPG